MAIRFRVGYVAFFIFLLLSKTCWAQDSQYQFNQVNPPDSIPPHKVTGITQDPQGYMWFVHQRSNNPCQIRYDSYKMWRYSYNPADSNSLGGRNLEVVYADKEGNIWLGTGNGLDQFDTKTGHFHK